MKYLICKHGDTAPGKAKASLTRGNSVIIIKDVPAEICQNGGEYYLSEEITQRVLALAEDAVRQGVEVEEDVTPTRAERNHDHSWRIHLD